MTAHTPGPWTWVQGYGGNHGIAGPNRESIASVRIGDGFWPDTYNARLIAAAPDMLAALKSALPYFISGACPEIQSQMQSAIAKAEGKS